MRQFGCIEITRTDGLLLRDAIRPLARVEPFDPGSAISFCEKLYDGILKMKVNSLESINLPLDEREALFINQFVGNEDWEGALTLLDETDELQKDAIRHRQAAAHPAASAPAGSGSGSSSSVLDDSHDFGSTPGTSGSLLGSSVIRHNIKCKCGEHVPMWYARCPACGQYIEH